MVGRLAKPGKKKEETVEAKSRKPQAVEVDNGPLLKKLEEVEARLDAIQQELSELRSKL